MNIRSICKYLTLVIGGLAYSQLYGQQITSNTSGESDADFRSTLDRYCVSCHNTTLNTANLALDLINVQDLSEAPQIWEKVITKLSLRSMPPVGMPRPDDSFYISFITYLEEALDGLAENQPDPGRTVIAHRLNRTEYTNAVGDLLDVDVDAPVMFPADNSGGFDNLGELLSVSEVLMENYIDAARVVSRLAIGDPTLPVDSIEYTVDPTLLQNQRMNEDLPFGSRGGIAVRHRFPLDGEYVLNIRLLRSDQEALIVGLAEPRRLDVRVDGRRLRLFTIGGDHVGLAQDGPQDTADKFDPMQARYERTADESLQVRFPIGAGTHTVQVTFLEESLAWEAYGRPPSYEFFNSTLGDTSSRQWVEPAVSSITINGPYNVTGVGNTESRDRIFICHPERRADEQACAREILSNLARLAYRRPVNDADISPLLDLYSEGRTEMESFELGIERALEGLLSSPGFLFRFERDPAGIAGREVYRISDLELASRLAFFLWSSIPDDQLLTLAEQGRLSQPDILVDEVSRMLNDRRADSLTENFAEQWLLLRNLPQIHKNREIFPEFDETLRQALHREVTLFVGSIFKENRSILDLLRADYTFLNERLASHYGIEDVHGSQFRRVTLTDKNQQGLLARAGILAITSYPNRNSTVLRGKWVLENILASPPPPPPTDIPPLEAVQAAPGEILTLREKMEIHPANPACAVCHNQMDPIGFGLENYNAIGQWRTEDQGEAINASGRLPSGVQFEGPGELQEALLSDPEVFVSAFVQKLLTYALGRPLEYHDMPAVRKIVKQAAENEYRLDTIVIGIVKSVPFQMRRAAS